MAHIHGTATDHADLWAKLLDFLQNNTDLVSAGQAWTIPWQADTGDTPTNLLLKGTGMAGQDEIYVGMLRSDDAKTVGESTVKIAGAAGMLAGATNYNQHVNSLGDYGPGFFLDSGAMDYWFTANGRRFMGIVKISTVYQAFYGGFFLPYATPDSYGIPLFCGGSFNGFGNQTYIPQTWRATPSEAYNHFVYPNALRGSSQGCFLAPDGSWLGGDTHLQKDPYLGFANFGPRQFQRYIAAGNSGASSNYYSDIGAYNYHGETTSGAYGYVGYEHTRQRIIPGLDGEVPFMPITLMTFNDNQNPDPTTFGVLDGCYSISGQGQSAENIITVNGIDHLVVPNVARSTVDEYWAFALD